MAKTSPNSINRQQLVTDVLVIGLGPGGGSAAKAAAEAGLKVLGVDKKQRIGYPVQCAEFVPMPMSRYATDAPVRIQEITGMKSYLPSGAVEETDFPGLMIDREAFDAAIAQNAKQAGAEIKSGAMLKNLDVAHHRAMIACDRKLVEVHYRCLIAADGPHSAVTRLLDLPFLDTVNTRQYTVPLLKPFADTDIWLNDNYPGGYAWLFPKGEVANLGLGANKDFQSDLKVPLDNLHKQLIEQGIVGEQILHRTGGLIPVGGMREQLVVDSVLFVGDAAGLTHPITGAGISAAVQSGEMAGQAVADFLNGDEDALEDYEEEVRDQYEVTLQRAVERRQRLKKVWHTPAAQKDKVMRTGWIAFDEYFEELNHEDIKNTAKKIVAV